MNVEEIPAKLKESWSDLQMQVAGLRTRLLAPRLLVELHDGGLRGWAKGFRQQQGVELPLPPGICRRGLPREVEALGDLVGDLLLELGMAGARVTAALPLQASQWRLIRWPLEEHPDEPEEALRQLAPELDLGFPLDQAYLNLQPLPPGPGAGGPGGSGGDGDGGGRDGGGGGVRSLLVASPRELVDAWAEVFDIAGLELHRLLPAQICEWRALQELGLVAVPGAQALDQGPLQGAMQGPGQEQWLLQLEPEQQRLWLVADGVPQADWTLPPPAPTPLPPPPQSRDTAPQERPAQRAEQLAAELERRLRVWAWHRYRQGTGSAGRAQRQWWLYGRDPELLEALLPLLAERLPAEPLAVVDQEALAGELSLRLTGLKWLSGW